MPVAYKGCEAMIKEIRNVAVYLRISRESGETQDTLLSHRTIAERIMKERNYSYYIYEEIISGASAIEERKELFKVLQDIEKDVHDALFVISIDRISRDNLYSQMVAKVLTDNDIPIITPEKIYDLNGDDRLLFDMQSMVSSQELRQITKRMKRGKQERAKRGEWVQGKPPLGYKRNETTKKLEIVESEAEIVKFIFNLAESGYGIPTITKQLSSYKTRDGNRFNASSVNKILSNTTYTGTISYNVKDKRGNVTDSIATIDSHDPIVQLGQFKNVQSAIKGRISGDMTKRNRSKGECISILKDLVYCGLCGLKMGIKRDSKRREKVYVNKCRCGNKGIMEDKLLSEFWDELSIVEKQLRQSFQKALETPTDVSKEFLIESIEELKKTTEKMHGKLKRFRDAYIEGVFTKEEYLSDKAIVEKELSSINNSISELSHKVKLLDTETITNEYETKLKWLADVRKLGDMYNGKLFIMGEDLKNAPSPKVETKDIAEVNRLLKLVIDKVHYHRYDEETNLYEDGFVDIEKGDFIQVTVSPK
ncbi:recombinase family protein [Bacillus sp. CMF21]|nr:recombinase family protein [Bacillus sp. CMF21]